MYSTNFLKVLLLTASVLLLNYGGAYADPVTQAANIKYDGARESLEEVEDLLMPSEDMNVNKGEGKGANLMEKEASFAHRDEDLPRKEVNFDLEQTLKYDVEVLESRDIKKENIEIEERFKGSALQMNTDTFIEENIEVHGGENILDQSHMILTIILVIVALVSIGLYAALVIWRSHLEQRYGMRELLVTDCDDYFHHTGSSTISSSNGNNDTRQFVLA